MTKHMFGRVVVSGDNVLIPVKDDTGTVIETLDYPRDDLIHVIVEIVSAYDVEPVAINEIIPQDLVSVLVGFPRQYPGVELYYDDQADEFIITCKNGDTGVKDEGHGPTAVAALADLARSHGFKSKLPQGGTLSIAQWFVDFQYGFKRISDEVLAAELEMLTAPDKGAW